MTGRSLARHRDLVLGLVLGTAMVIELLVRADPGPAVVVIGFVSGAGLAGRRTFPIPAFLVSMGGLALLGHLQPGWGDSSIVLLVVYLIAWYSLGAHASGWQMWLGAGFVLVGVVEFVATDGSRFSAADVPFGLAMVGGPWAAGVTVRLMRGRERSLTAEKAELERTKEEEAQRAVASERARIARELHDVVSHAISVTVLQARGGRRMVGTDDRAVIDALDAIEQTNTAALGDMRRLLAVLRDTDDPAVARQAPQPTLARLGDLVDQVRHSGLPVRLEQEGAHETVPPGVDLSAYRIIQEALTNVLKHGGEGASAWVRVAYGTDRLRLEVSDNGCGASTAQAGHGLLGIRERVAVIGGAVEAGPGPDGGYVVSADLPYSTSP